MIFNKKVFRFEMAFFVAETSDSFKNLFENVYLSFKRRLDKT